MDINVYLEKVTKLPTPHKLGILAGVVILIFVAYYFFIYLNKKNELDKVNKSLARLQSELVEKKAIADNLGKFKEEVDKLDAKLKEALAKLPNESEIDQLLIDIPNLGKESGLTFTKFVPRNESKRGFYAEVPIEVEFRGQYFDVAKFFYKLSNLSRIVNFKDIAMEPAGGGGGKKKGDQDEKKKDEEPKMMLKVSGKAVTYRFIEQSTSEEGKN